MWINQEEFTSVRKGLIATFVDQLTYQYLAVEIYASRNSYVSKPYTIAIWSTWYCATA
jgi:hypothetical protein